MKLNKNSSDEEFNRKLTNDGVLELSRGGAILSHHVPFSPLNTFDKTERQTGTQPTPHPHCYMYIYAYDIPPFFEKR